MNIAVENDCEKKICQIADFVSRDISVENEES